MEEPWPLALAQNSHLTEKPSNIAYRELDQKTGRARRRHNGYRRNDDRRTPQGMTQTWTQEEGGQRGGQMGAGDGGRCRRAAQVAETSVRVRRMAGVGDV